MSIPHIGAALDRLEAHYLERASQTLSLHDPLTLAQNLADYAKAAWRVSHLLSRSELDSRGRSYALPSPEDEEEDDGYGEMADLYGEYFAHLAYTAHGALKGQILALLSEIERGGLTVKEGSIKLAQVLPGFTSGRLRTILRTEGTRVANAAREKLVAQYAEKGTGPDFYIFDAILDGRTTRSCNALDGYRIPCPLEGIYQRLRPGLHFNCRSLLRFGYADEQEDLEAPLLTVELAEQMLIIRDEEFPGWDSQS